MNSNTDELATLRTALEVRVGEGLSSWACRRIFQIENKVAPPHTFGMTLKQAQDDSLWIAFGALSY